MDINTGILILGDAFEELKKIEDGSVDLIFVDPPYFMQTDGNLLRVEGEKFEGIDEKWDKFGSFDDYDFFTYGYLKECRRVLKNSGTIWVIGSFQNIYRIGNIMQNMGFWILNDIIWKKTNPTPNFKGSRFTNAHETLLWCKKSKNSKYTFNYQTMKHLNHGKQMGSVWEIPVCRGKERIKTGGKKAHPTQKPQKLLLNIILSSSKPGEIVLDPFMGVGTAPAVAKMLKRKYIGIEKDKKYFDLAVERVLNTPVKNEDVYNNVLDRKPPKADIKEMIKKGYFKTGEYFYDKKGNRVRLLRNGRLSFKDREYSIHKMAAEFLNRLNYNGWNYWYVLRDGRLVEINEIRKTYRNNEYGFK